MEKMQSDEWKVVVKEFGESPEGEGWEPFDSVMKEVIESTDNLGRTRYSEMRLHIIWRKRKNGQ